MAGNETVQLPGNKGLDEDKRATISSSSRTPLRLLDGTGGGVEIVGSVRKVAASTPRTTDEPLRGVLAQVAELRSQIAAIAAGRGRNATQEERSGWNEYLLSLAGRQRDGRISAFQVRSVLDVWQRALEIEPNVMYPTAGTTEDGDLYLVWNPPGRTLTLEVYRDGIDWFYEDLATNDRDGSEDAAAAPPPRFFTYLRGFTRK